MANSNHPQAQSGDPASFDADRPSAHEIDSMVRVDQAGEYGATRIYAGQLAVLGDHIPERRAIRHMAEQEEEHRAFFNQLITERGVRPTALQPFWDIAGFALGAGTALISLKAAMACTAAVETKIDLHYQQQLERLGQHEPELSSAIARFREEELEHKHHAIEAGAEQAPAYPVMNAAIRLGCRIAIALAKRI